MKSDDIETLCKALVEMMAAAPSDLCGEHRTFYGRRIGDAFASASKLFPVQMSRELTVATNPDRIRIQP